MRREVCVVHRRTTRSLAEGRLVYQQGVGVGVYQHRARRFVCLYACVFVSRLHCNGTPRSFIHAPAVSPSRAHHPMPYTLRICSSSAYRLVPAGEGFATGLPSLTSYSVAPTFITVAPERSTESTPADAPPAPRGAGSRASRSRSRSPFGLGSVARRDLVRRRRPSPSALAGRSAS